MKLPISLLCALLASLSPLPLLTAASPATAVTAATGTAAGTAADLLDVATYSVRTVRRNPDGSDTAKTTPGVVGVPTLVDVDRTLLPAPDLTVSVAPLPSPTPRIRLDVSRLTAGKLPAQVEVVFDLPDGIRGVAFGYDGRTATAPASFSTTVTFSTGEVTDILLDTRTLGAGSTLSLLASLFTRGEDAQRVDPTEASVALAPVPTSLAAHARLDPGVGRVEVDLTNSSSTTAGLSLTDRRLGNDLSLAATIDRVPSSVSLDVTGSAAEGAQEVTYTASDPIATLTTDFRQVKGDQATDLHATARNVPSSFTLQTSTPSAGAMSGSWQASARLGALEVDVQRFSGGSQTSQIVANATDVAPTLSFAKDGTHATFVADEAIGSAEVGLSRNRSVVLAENEPAHYLKVVDGSLAVRVLGLRSFEVDVADPLSLSAELAPAPLHADLSLDGRHVDAMVDHLPSQLRNLSFSAAHGVLDYHARDGIDRFTADVTGDDPIVQRADRVRLTVRDVPRDLTLEFGNKAPSTVSTQRVCEIGEDLPDCDPFPGDGGEDPGDDTDPTDQFDDASMKQRVLLDTNGGTVGSAALLLTSGPDAPAEPLPAGQDGVVVEDLADRFVVFARVTGLQFAFVDLLVDDKRNVPGGRFLTTHHTATLRVDPEVNGRRPLVVDHRRQRGLLPDGKIDRLHAFVTDLPHEVGIDFRDFQRVFVSPLPKLTQAVYEASEPIRAVTLDADIPGQPNPLFLRAENVPTRVSLCKASDNTCGEQEKSDHGSFSLHASTPVRLSAFVCFNPAPCTHDDPSAFTDGIRLQDVTVQDLEFELNLGDLTADDPFQVRLDTNGRPVTGDIQLMGGGIVDLKFPGPWLIDPNDVGGLQILGEWVGPLQANDRRVTFDKQVFQGPLLPQFAGSIEEDPETCIKAEIPVLGSETIFGGCD